MSCNSCSSITLPVGATGAIGVAGGDGDSVVVLSVYIRASSAPSTPIGGDYVFDTQVLTPPASWSSGVPSGSDPCYVSHGTASVNGTTGTDSSITWGTPVIAFQDGVTGADGTSVLYESTAINSPTTIGSTFTDAISTTIAASSVGTVGDIIRVEFVVINDFTPSPGPYVDYSVDVQFGPSGGAYSEMFGVQFGNSESNLSINGAIISLDLVVTATNTITPRLNKFQECLGIRTTQYYAIGGKSYVAGITPAFGISGASVSPASITLTGATDLKVRLKNSTNLATDLASVVSITVLKLLKV